MKKVIVFIVLSCVVVACSTVLFTGRKQLLLVPDSEVLALSSANYREFIGSTPASQDKANTALVKKVGAKISKAVENYLLANGREKEISQYSWEFSLVKGNVVNAFCMPGGKVVFYEGILPVTQNETGIAVVMGHEVAHAVAKHSSERLSHHMMVQYGAALADILSSKQSAPVRTGIKTLYGIGSQVGVILPFSRTHEYEADQLGLIFMAMAGYDPAAAVGFWERMAAMGGDKGLELLSTHPSDANRIAKIKSLLPEAQKYYSKK